MDEIKTFEFMNKNNNGNLTNLQKRVLETEELNRRLHDAPYDTKREILEENKHNERDKHIAKMKKAKERQILGRKIVLYAASVSILAGGIGLVKHQINEVNKPINIVTYDVMANTKLLENDGKTADPTIFDSRDTDKLYNYIEESNISNEDLYENIAKYCKREMIDYNFAITKINERYPELFENSLDSVTKTK